MASTDDLIPTFVWTPVAKASRYELLVSDASNRPVIHKKNLKNESLTPVKNLVPGLYKVKVRAIVGQGRSGGKTGLWSATRAFFISPATIGVGSTTSLEGTPIAINRTLWNPRTADVFSYGWRVTKDGVNYLNGSGRNLSFTPDDNGLYGVTLEVFRKGKKVGTSERTLTVHNVAPSATIVGAPNNSLPGIPISLTSRAADPGSADNLTYAWQVIKNGANYAASASAACSFTPDENGTYVVSLTVLDDDGGIATNSVTIANIANNAPMLTVANTVISVDEGTAATNTGTFGGANQGDSVTLAASIGTVIASGNGGWTWGFLPTDGPSQTQTITITASDSHGASTTKTFSLIVNNVAPTATLVGVPDVTTEDTPIFLTASVSDPSTFDAANLTFGWVMTRDSQTLAMGNGPSFSVTPADGGAYVITLTVTDHDGGIGIDTKTLAVSLSPEHFAQQLEQIDAELPLPNSGFPLDWTVYSGSQSNVIAENAVFDISNWYTGKPGTDALNVQTLPSNGADAIAALEERVNVLLAALDSDIGNLAALFGTQQNVPAGVDTYEILRQKVVEQAVLQFLDHDLANVQAGQQEELSRAQAARDIAIHSLIPVPDSAPVGSSTEDQLANVRSQQLALIANLGILAVGQQTQQEIAGSSKFQAILSAAMVGVQEIQTANQSTRTTLVALQAREADLMDIAEHPLDHLTWPSVSGVDFAVGMLAGSFDRLAISPDEGTLATIESDGRLALRDSSTGNIRQILSGPARFIAMEFTADDKLWTATRDTVTLRDAVTNQIVWQWQDPDRTFTMMTATQDGSLAAVVTSRTLILLSRNGNNVTRSEITLQENLQADFRFNPAGTFLALPMQSTLVLLNVGTQETYQFGGFRDWVNTVAWSGDGTMVAAGDMKGLVQIIDVPTKQKIGSFQMPFNYIVGALAFSPNQALLATGDANVGLMLWDITHLDQIHEYARSTGKKDVVHFRKSLTGNTLLTRHSSGLVAYSMPEAGRGTPISRTSPPILDPILPTPPATPDHPSWSQSSSVPGTLGSVGANRFTSISPDGQSFIIPDGGIIEISSIATGLVTQTLNLGGDIRFAALTSDGQKMVLVLNGSNISTLVLRNLSTGAADTIGTFPALMMGAAVDAAHNLAAIADHAGGSRVRVFDLATGAAEEIPDSEDHSEAIAISESGRYVAVGTKGGAVVVYDRVTGQSHVQAGLHLEIKALAWSHGTDGVVAAADTNGHLALFSPTGVQPFSVFSAPYDSDPTTAIQFSENNLLLFRAANANGLLTFDVSSVGSPRVSNELPLLEISGARPLALSATGDTLFTTAVNNLGSTFITGVTIPAYGRGPANPSVPPPNSGSTPSTPPLNSAQQNELAAPTTIATLNPMQQQHLLDCVTAYFSERVLEGGTPGVPYLYLAVMESNPALLNLSTSAPYRDFFVGIVADMRAKWPLQNEPHLHLFAGGSGLYIPPSEPVSPPTPTPNQTSERLSVEQLLLAQLRSPVRLAAGQWVSVRNIDPNLTTHTGAELNAVDLSLPGDARDTNPNFDKGQPVYAPMAGIVKRLDRLRGQLVIEHNITLADGTKIIVTTVMFHLLVDDSLHKDQVLRQGTTVGNIWNLTDGTIQSDGETTVDSHLHFSVHLGMESDASLDLTEWLLQERIGTLYTSGADTGTEGGATLAPAFKARQSVATLYQEVINATSQGSTLITSQYAFRSSRFTSISAGPMSIASRVIQILASIPQELQRDLFDPLQNVLDGAHDFLVTKAAVERQQVLREGATLGDRAAHFTTFGLLVSLQSLVEGVQIVTPRSPGEAILMAAAGELTPVVAKAFGFLFVYGKQSSLEFIRRVANALQRGGAPAADALLEETQLALRQSGKIGLEQAQAISAIERETFAYKKPEYRPTLDLVQLGKGIGHGLTDHISSGNVLSDQLFMYRRLIEHPNYEITSLFRSRTTALDTIEAVLNDYWKAEILPWSRNAVAGQTRAWSFSGNGNTALGSIMRRFDFSIVPGYNARVVFKKIGPNAQDIALFTYYVE